MGETTTKFTVKFSISEEMKKALTWMTLSEAVSAIAMGVVNVEDIKIRRASPTRWSGLEVA